MELTLLSKRKKMKCKIEQEHYWYDAKLKQMLRGRGGRMQFVYNPTQKRSVPVIVDHAEWVDGNNYSDIKKWVEHNHDKYNFAVESDNGVNVTISVDNTHLDDIQEDLYRHGIVSDY